MERSKFPSKGFIRLILFVAVWWFVSYCYLTMWPPDWYVRSGQRKMVSERVQAAGGWTALQRACDALMETNRGVFDWWYYREDDSAKLPPSIAALKPQEVIFIPPKILRGSGVDASFMVVQIKIFGMHRSGARAIPYFGLEVASGTNADSYAPRPKSAASGNSHDTYRKLTNWIYEVY
jgi:hypothetical protein